MPTHHQVFEDVRKHLRTFHQEVEMPGGYTFDHQDTLKRIDLYYNGHFESGPYDNAGFKKFFYNITKPACDIATKFVDLDTKDITLVSERAGDEYKIWVMQRDLKQWMKENRVGTLLNEIAHSYPKYGHVVVKKAKAGEIDLVNLVNLRMDPTVDVLENSPFVYEIHYMSRREIEEMPWETEAVNELFRDRPDEHQFKVYECYQLSQEGKKKWDRYFLVDFLRIQEKDGAQTETAESAINDEQDYAPGYLLHEDTVDELPYRELKWEEIPGRWLGFGFAEYLFDNQIRQNELINVKAKALHLSSLKLFQTADEMIAKNVLTDMENGEIIQTPSGVSQVDMSTHTFGEFQGEEARWDLNADRKTFSFDIVRGDSLPSGTPLGVARLTAAQVASYFEIKRENFGLFLKDLIINNVIPSFQKEKRKSHLLKFFGSDKEIGKLRKAYNQYLTRKTILDWAEQTGVLPSQTAIDLVKAEVELAVKQKKDLNLEIPEGFYQDARFVVDILVTGESIDVGSKLQTLQVALQLMGTNPAIVEVPATRTVFLKMLELAGVSAVELDLLEEKMEEPSAVQNLTQGQQQGSSMPQAPTQPQQPITGGATAQAV